jgi:spore germination cell wall hydrolase CwlJ-like protein
VATLCIALYSSAAVAKGCNPNDPNDELKALALNMYFEARGDGKTIEQRLYAMQMVGEVTLNRVESVNYPDSICEVVYQESQFSWTRKRDKTPYETKSWLQAVILANRLLNGKVDYIDNGATHFVNLKGVSHVPSWTRRFDEVARVGKHVFYTDNSKRISKYMLEPIKATAGTRT